jgi:tRNA(fMet)-specific endonuclease VapC
MGVILDSSVLIAAERGHFRLGALLESLGDATVTIAAITASELLHGVHQASARDTRMRRSAFVEALLAELPVRAFGIGEARMHAALWAELAGSGTMIRAYDLLIAATALASGDALVTLNQGEFARVPGLRVQSTVGFV